MLRISLLGIGALLAIASTTRAESYHEPGASCATISKTFTSPNVTVYASQHVPANSTVLFPPPSCQPSQLSSVDICRVTLFIKTSPTSGVNVEAWLPSNWNGRLVHTGNGGLAGCIYYSDLAYANSLGFAAIAGNAGHNGTSYNAVVDDQVLSDFVYRSVHVGVTAGKDLVKSFYGKPQKKSYFLGCSTGGRQGMKSAQDYPEDFDGIIAGAPAIAFSNLTSWQGLPLTLTGPNTSSTHISEALWEVIHNEILDRCDKLDGAKDGIIEDPDLCQVRAEALICGKGKTTNCLSRVQVEVVDKIYTDLYGPGGSLIYPRKNPGSELGDYELFYAGEPFSIEQDWFRYVVFKDPTWDPFSLTLEDMVFASSLNPFNVDTWNGDLSAFQARGGKLLHYHGTQDTYISSFNSERYYNHVSRTMNLPSSELDSFYRFFRIGGMGHCMGGPGAWELGQGSGSVAAANTPQQNILLRLVDWVENGRAPETVTGTKFVNDAVSQGVQFKRNHCKYPKRNTFVGYGSSTNPDGWACV